MRTNWSGETIPELCLTSVGSFNLDELHCRTPHWQLTSTSGGTSTSRSPYHRSSSTSRQPQDSGTVYRHGEISLSRRREARWDSITNTSRFTNTAQYQFCFPCVHLKLYNRLTLTSKRNSNSWSGPEEHLYQYYCSKVTYLTLPCSKGTKWASTSLLDHQAN